MAVEANRGKRKKTRAAIMEFTAWKQEVMSRLVADDKLAKLLKYNTPNCLSLPVPTDSEREDLINTQVFGYRFIPTVAQDQKSFISLGLSNFVPQEGFRQFSDDYVQGYLYFYVLVDSALLDTETGYRNDLIIARIYDIFQEATGLGMGELRMEACTELWQHGDKFGGYTMGFKMVSMK